MNQGQIAAVIFGAQSFPKWPDMTGTPAFRASAEAIVTYLHTRLGIAHERILDLFDSSDSAVQQIDSLIAFLDRNESSSDLIIYYVGHGDMKNKEYCLILNSSSCNNPTQTSLAMSVLSNVVTQKFGTKRVYLILDCCYGGLAVNFLFQSSTLATAVARDAVEAFRGSGMALLVAAAKDRPALVSTEFPMTLFTSVLIDVLEKGIPGEGAYLSLDAIGSAIRTRIGRQYPASPALPEVHSPRQYEGNIAKFGLFPNPVAVPVPVDEEPLPSSPEPAPKRPSAPLIGITATAVGAAFIGAFLASNPVISVKVSNKVTEANSPQSPSSDAEREAASPAPAASKQYIFDPDEFEFNLTTEGSGGAAGISRAYGASSTSINPLLLRPGDKIGAFTRFKVAAARIDRPELIITLPDRGFDFAETPPTATLYDPDGRGTTTTVTAHKVIGNNWAFPLTVSGTATAGQVLMLRTSMLPVVGERYASGAVRQLTMLIASAQGYIPGPSTTLAIDDTPHITDVNVIYPSSGEPDSSKAKVQVTVKDYNGCTTPNTGNGAVSLESDDKVVVKLQPMSCIAASATAVYEGQVPVVSEVAGIRRWRLNVTGRLGLKPRRHAAPFDRIDYPADVLNIAVNSPSGPRIEDAKLSRRVVGSAEAGLTLRWYTARIPTRHKVVMGISADCTSGAGTGSSQASATTMVTDWTSTTGGAQEIQIPVSSLQEGLSHLTLCVARHDSEAISKILLPVIKDTTLIEAGIHSAGPANVTTGDSFVEVYANKPGWFRTRVGDTPWSEPAYFDAVGFGTRLRVENSRLVSGKNLISIAFTDLAGTEKVLSSRPAIGKIGPAPSMNGRILPVDDILIDDKGVIAPGRMKVSWVPVDSSAFESYRIQLFPGDFSSDDFERKKSTFPEFVITGPMSSGNWVSENSIRFDSLGNALVPGDYTIFMTVMSLAGQVGESGRAKVRLTR